jgi:hypothetical protein
MVSWTTSFRTLESLVFLLSMFLMIRSFLFSFLFAGRSMAGQRLGIQPIMLGSLSGNGSPRRIARAA